MKSKSIVFIIANMLIVTLFLLLTFILNANILYFILLILWFFLFLYASCSISNNVVIQLYLISFFVFLMAREFCFEYLGIQRYYRYLEDYNDITFLLLIISLLFIFVGYNFANGKIKIVLGKKRRKNNIIHTTDVQNIRKETNYRFTCKVAFYICYFFSLIITVFQVSIVKNIGYLNTYISGTYDTNGIISAINYIGAFAGVALSLFLATKPTKKQSLIALAFYEFYGILTLFTGHRYTFIAISMYIIIYAVLRNNVEGGWVKKRYFVYVIIFIPIIVVLMTVLDSLRLGRNYELNGILTYFVDFLDQQGGSINVIKRIFYYEDEIADMKFTSFSNFRAVLFENSIMRNLFDIDVYSGNSFANATKGHSLAHRLSYLDYGSRYFYGHGVGSCYIAELFHDFGILGVCVGNFVYGYIMKKINLIKFKSSFKDGLLLAIIYYLLLAPRGDFDGFVSSVFGLYSLLGMLCIWIVTYLLNVSASASGKEG